jgi:hypothetical protein
MYAAAPMRARPAMPTPTPMPACAPVLRPPLLVEFEFALVAVGSLVIVDEVGLEDVVVAAGEVVDEKDETVLGVELWAVDVNDDPPVMTCQFCGDTAVNVCEVTVPLQPPFPQHIQRPSVES